MEYANGSLTLTVHMPGPSEQSVNSSNAFSGGDLSGKNARSASNPRDLVQSSRLHDGEELLKYRQYSPHQVDCKSSFLSRL
jgi:hypothetical protein